MKTINILFILVLFFLLECSLTQGCCGSCGGCCGNSNQQVVAQVDPNPTGQVVNNLRYFIGNWVGLDYSCQRGGILEQVNFPDVPNQIYANKVTGDSCVHAGQVTFRFNQYPNQLLYKTNYAVTWTVGSPGRPQSGFSGGQLQITGRDEFNISGLRFVRGRLVNDQLVRENIPLPPPPVPKPCKTTTVKEITRQTLDSNGKVISSTRERIIETVAERVTDTWVTTDTILQVFNKEFNTNSFEVVEIN